jgi:hypothetical protein
MPIQRGSGVSLRHVTIGLFIVARQVRWRITMKKKGGSNAAESRQIRIDELHKLIKSVTNTPKCRRRTEKTYLLREAVVPT